MQYILLAWQPGDKWSCNWMLYTKKELGRQASMDKPCMSCHLFGYILKHDGHVARPTARLAYIAAPAMEQPAWLHDATCTATQENLALCRLVQCQLGKKGLVPRVALPQCGTLNSCMCAAV
jgi:hypothetical protein